MKDLGKKIIFNSNLMCIINAIKTDLKYVDIFELLDWVIDNGYFNEFRDNLIFICFMIFQHNERLK